MKLPEMHLEHRYSIADSNPKYWKQWYRKNGLVSMSEWWCHSIHEAAKNYSWIDAKPTFEELSEKLRDYLIANDNEAAAEICLQIYKWGGVAKKKTDRSYKWTLEEAESGGLCKKINEAVYLLSPGSNAPLTGFDGTRLLMNSAVTKVYAAAGAHKSVVIYDGRVGAALGLLVRHMLEEFSLDCVPDPLKFEWGPPSSNKLSKLKTRDPSNSKYPFKQLPNTSNNDRSDMRRAELSRLTNTLCHRVVELLRRDGKDTAPDQIERALFMIGYDVRKSI
jgi:hypothetical protein